MTEDLAINDWPQENRAGGRSTVYRNVMLGLLTVAAVAAVGLLGTLTYYAVTDRQAATEAAAAEKAAEIDKTALAAQVTTGIQSILDGDEDTSKYGIQFKSDMVLFQLAEGGSEYRGLVTALTRKATEVPVMVTAYADDSGSMFYQIDPSSNIRLNQIAEDEEPKECTGYYC